MDSNSLEWLRQSRNAGFSDQEIQNQLMAAGWNEAQIRELFQSDIAVQTSFHNTEREETTSLGFEELVTVSPGGNMPGVFSLMGIAWQITKQRIVIFAVIMLLSAVIAVIAMGIFMLLSMFGFGAALFSFDEGISATTGLLLFAGIAIYYIIFSLAMSWIQFALVLSITEAHASIGSIITKSFKRIFSYWWLLLLTGFLVGGASMLFSIPGIVFAIWFSFSIFVLGVEGIKGMQALLRSKEYVRNYWWPVLGRNLAFGLMIGIPLMILFALVGLAKSETLLVIFQFIFSLVLLPFGVAYNYSQYVSLRKIKGDSMPTPQKKGGLIATAIIGWILIPGFLFLTGSVFLGSARDKARDAQRMSDVAQLRTALFLYYDDEGEFPSNLDLLEPEYIFDVPIDPETLESYEYTVLLGGSDFELCATFENKSVSGSKERCMTSQWILQ